MKKEFAIVISSDQRFERLVAEIYVPDYPGLFLAGVRRADADDAFVVEVRGPYAPGTCVDEIEFDLLCEALQGAKRALENG